jgi:hypothetical protein
MGTPANILIGGAAVQIPDETDLGYIKDGLHISKEEEVYYVTGIEGLPTPPVAHRTSIQFTMSGTLIEPTLANIKKVWAVSSAVASPMELGQVAEMDCVSASGNDNCGVTNILFTSLNPAGFVREIEAVKAIADGPGEMVLTDAEEVSLPFTYKVIWDGTQSIIITDAAA